GSAEKGVAPPCHPAEPVNRQEIAREPTPDRLPLKFDLADPSSLQRIAELANKTNKQPGCHSVEVLYDKRDPNQAMINSPAMWTGTILWLGAAALSGLFCTMIVYLGKKPE